ncbi:hypothetical protein [Vibrio crassostreae]|uniref:hypothetical protein n=1 Tax=Vibrio crassostreae TaxID=246167 RepID=UPI001B30469B|nr:hypothetical protein [Vibrio crassostreae]
MNLILRRRGNSFIDLTPQTFTVSKNADGILDGWTTFFDDEETKVEAKYFYVLGRCDYLRSEGFEAGSMAIDRQKMCIKKNKKEKISDEFEKYRFFSLDKGVYSLKDVFGEMSFPKGTDIDRLRSIDRKFKDAPKGWLSRWCDAGLCGCMGCVNGSARKYANITREEHKDYLLFLRYIAREHEVME